MRSLALPVSVLLGGLVADPALADDTQAWGTVTVQAGLGGNWRAHSETIVRSGNARGFYEIEENLMIGYRPDPKVTLWLGYTFDPNYLHGELTVTEHRFRQQVNVDGLAKLGPVRVTARVRLEERWRDGQAGTGWRLRPQVKASLPILGKTALFASHESFIDLNTTTFQRTGGYDRWRNVLGISAPLSKRMSVEVGYLNQHTFVRNGPDTDDHVLNVGLSASF